MDFNSQALSRRRKRPFLTRDIDIGDAVAEDQTEVKDMRVFDADGYVEESPVTFSGEYLDLTFRSQRPRVVGMDKMVYWMIEEQLFPAGWAAGAIIWAHPSAFPTHQRENRQPGEHGAHGYQGTSPGNGR